MKNIICLLFLLFSLTIIAQKPYNIADIPVELLNNANSIILDEVFEIDVRNEKKLMVKHYQVIAVLNKNGRNDAVDFISYNEDSKVKKVEAFVYDVFGEELEHFKRKDFIDISAVDGGTIYSDARVLFYKYTPISYPYIAVFTSEKESNSTAFIPDWFPVVGYERSTVKSNYILRFSPLNKPRIKARNFEEFDITLTEKLDEISYNAKNIEAFEHEYLSQHYSMIFPSVEFSLDKFYLKGVPGSARNWKEFGKWRYDNLIAGLDELHPVTIAKMQQIVVGVDSEKEKVKQIYEYVQNKTRYISVQLGIGGWKPYPASDIDNLGYGDCKGLTNYTKALLKSQGIESYYSVVWAGSEKRNVDNEFASMQGNHVILNVPLEEGEIWLECTSQNIPFGFLGDFTDDRDVLVITPEGGKIAHTDVYKPEMNRLITSGVCEIEANGNLIAAVKMKSYGLQYNQLYSIETLDKKKQDLHYKNYWDYIDNLSLASIKFNNDKNSIEFTEEVKFSANSYAIFAGEEMIVPVNILNQSFYIPKRYKNRKRELSILRGYVDNDEVIIKLPEGYKLQANPEPILLDTKFGTYKSTIEKVSENEIIYKRQFKTLEGTYPKEEYSNYRSFRKKVAKYDKQKIILIKA